MSAEHARWLVVRQGSQWVALPLGSVVETFRPLPVQPLEGVPSFVLGAAVVRGEPVPVVDLGRLLEGAAGGPPPSRWVTLRAGGRVAALAVEAVAGLADLAAAGDLPPLLAGAAAGALAALASRDGQLLAALEASRIVPEEAWARIRP